MLAAPVGANSGRQTEPHSMEMPLLGALPLALDPRATIHGLVHGFLWQVK